MRHLTSEFKRWTSPKLKVSEIKRIELNWSSESCFFFQSMLVHVNILDNTHTSRFWTKSLKIFCWKIDWYKHKIWKLWIFDLFIKFAHSLSLNDFFLISHTKLFKKLQKLQLSSIAFSRINRKLKTLTKDSKKNPKIMRLTGHTFGSRHFSIMIVFQRVQFIHKTFC